MPSIKPDELERAERAEVEAAEACLLEPLNSPQLPRLRAEHVKAMAACEAARAKLWTHKVVKQS